MAWGAEDTVLKPALTYFSMVFGVGFVLGTLRVLLLVPRVGVRAAELLELPLMVVVMVLAARWATRRWVTLARPAWLGVGLFALALLLAAEFGLGFALRGATPSDVLFARDPVSGAAYAASLAAFALMPLLLAPGTGRARA